MKQRSTVITLLSAAAMLALPAAAQTMRAGLWETHTSLGKGWGKALAGIEANNIKMAGEMSAEARKEMEESAAENAKHTRYTDDHVITKSCFTKEQVERISKKLMPNDGCTEQRSPMMAGVIKSTYTCTNPPSVGSSTLRMRGDTGFEMEMTSTMTVNRERHTTTGTVSGKWLGAHCGQIKPDSDED